MFILNLVAIHIASDRLFSQAKEFVHKERAKFKALTVEKYSLLNCWHRESV